MAWICEKYYMIKDALLQRMMGPQDDYPPPEEAKIRKQQAFSKPKEGPLP